MTNEIKNESKLGKIVKNLDVLVPFKMSVLSEKSEKSLTKRIINGIFSCTLLFGYIPGSSTFENANPLKWPEIYKQNQLREQQVKAEYLALKETWQSKIYKKFTGQDGVMDFQEFKNFYGEIDSLGIYWLKSNRVYNKK